MQITIGQSQDNPISKQSHPQYGLTKHSSSALDGRTFVLKEPFQEPFQEPFHGALSSGYVVGAVALRYQNRQVCINCIYPNLGIGSGIGPQLDHRPSMFPGPRCVDWAIMVATLVGFEAVADRTVHRAPLGALVLGSGSSATAASDRASWSTQ